MNGIHWASMLVALVLGTMVGLAFMACGVWMDKARENRWNRELENRPPLPVRSVKQRDNEENDRA